ncbi:MAG: fasciclin domain-containing protein [Pseudomonadota bacterium]|nr:fasciclin domain-containing protein [Pseudomonadota bacterium]
MKHTLATALAAGFVIASLTPAAAMNSSVEAALTSNGDVSMFHRALVNTGVASELDERTEYSVFAPTNAAFAMLKPDAYPCFYAVQCRGELAAVLRNHIVPRNESMAGLVKYGGDVPTLGNRRINVQEPFKGDYTVERRHVLNQSEGERVSVYRIDGVIANAQELAAFRVQPQTVVVEEPEQVIEKTVTTYRSPVVAPVVNTYPPIPGGYPAGSVTYVTTDGTPDNVTQTTTVTHTITTLEPQ